MGEDERGEGRKRWDGPVPAGAAEVNEKVGGPFEAVEEVGRVGLPVVFPFTSFVLQPALCISIFLPSVFKVRRSIGVSRRLSIPLHSFSITVPSTFSYSFRSRPNPPPLNPLRIKLRPTQHQPRNTPNRTPSRDKTCRIPRRHTHTRRLPQRLPLERQNHRKDRPSRRIDQRTLRMRYTEV